MEAISVTGFGDRGSPPRVRATSLSWPENGQRMAGGWPRTNKRTQTAIRARTPHQKQGPARSSNRVVGSLATPTGSNFERRLENFDFQPPPRSAGSHGCFLTESARTALGPDLDLGRRSPERRHPPGCTADAGCRLRYGPADRGRLPQRVRDRRGAIPAGRDLLRPQLHAVTALDFWNAPVRATGIDPGSIYTNTNCHSASYSGSTANAVVTGRRPRVSI